MIRTPISLLAALIIAFSFANCAHSQDQPVADEDATVETTDAATDEQPAIAAEEGTEGEEVASEEVAEETAVTDTVEQQAEEGKIYHDDVTTFVNSKVKFRLFARDDLILDKIVYKLDEQEMMDYTDPFNIEEEGNHVISYYGIDKSGNKEAEKSYRVVVDNSAPKVVVTTNTPVYRIDGKMYYSSQMLFNVTANDSLSGVQKIEYSINDSGFQEYVAPFKVDSLGQVDLKIRAIDNVNNVSEDYTFVVTDENGQEIELSEAILSLNRDNTAPVVDIKSDKPLEENNHKYVASTSTRYTVEATDEDSGISRILVRIDGQGDFIPYKGEISFLTNGAHMIEAQAIDKAGNMSNIAVMKVYVDLVPPVSNIETVSE